MFLYNVIITFISSDLTIIGKTGLYGFFNAYIFIT
jgi:hypothetical protein